MPVLKIRGWHGPAKQVALHHITPHIQQFFILDLGFHPFGHNRNPKPFANVDGGLSHDKSADILFKIRNKAAIDLDFGQRQVRQTRQG